MKSLIKKTAITLTMVLCISLLSACGDENGENGNLNTYDGGRFTINVASTWDILLPSEFYAEVPKETLIAFTAPESEAGGFFINVNIIKEESLPVNTTSSAYGQANILKAAQLTDYTKIQEANLESGTVHIFTARLNPGTALLRFIQYYTTDRTDGYIVSGGMPTETPEATRDLVGNIVTSFQIKDDSISTVE